MIALAISAGANVNAENPSNGATAIFFAVKYSSLRTVQMLLEQGATIDHRDNYGQTIWKNAVEFPDLEVIDFLLRRYADDIPVVRDRVKVRHQSTGKSYTFTLPDHMLGLYMGMLPTTDTPDMWMPVSWRVMGCPDNEILGTALLRVMQAGARLSGSSSASEESFSALGFDPLSIVTHIDDRRLEKSEMLEKRAPTGRILADVIFGRRLPAKIHAEILEKEHSPRILDPTCPICLTDMDERNQPITLYCGHRFCTVCIRSFGQATLSVEREMTDKRCPLCRRLLVRSPCKDGTVGLGGIVCPLLLLKILFSSKLFMSKLLKCGDLLSEDFKRKYRSGQIRFGVDRHREDELEDEFIIGDRGPHLLSDEQLQFECQRILGSSQRNRADMLRDLFAKMETASLDFSNGDTVNAQQKELKFELTATHSMAANEKFVILAPGIGPVFVPIQVKHVPLLAGLSPLSFFTVVPMSIVYSFRLKTKPIRSSRFINCFGNVVQVTAVIDDFKFCLGDIEICLNNAVVLSDNRIENIQLGMDFLESAAWVRCSTVVEAKEVKEAKALSTQYVVTDGGFSKDLFLSEQPDEIRYYSRDGRIAVLPFIHIKNLTMDASLPLVSLPDDILTTSFPECQWCCRCFPSDSLLHHNGRYYCDEECLTNGLKIRPD